MSELKKIYFASDVHLGFSKVQLDRDNHDKQFISWLDCISNDAEKIFLLGDIFDFWFEHRNNIPNYYGRVLSKLQELIGKGIEIHFFMGNHDMWTFGYLQNEIRLIVHHKPEEFILYNKKIVMGHGHNLKINEPFSLKLMNSIFSSKLIYKVATTIVHADLMLWFGRKWSRRKKKKNTVFQFKGEKESVTMYCKKYLKLHKDINYFVFGHFHTPISYPLQDGSTLFILSSWINESITYGTLCSDGEFELVSASRTDFISKK